MTLFVICDSALPGRNDGVARGIVCRLVFIFVTPPSYGHLPYILHSKTPRNTTGHGREEGGKYFPRIYFSNRRPLYRFATPNATGHGRGGKYHTNNAAPLPHSSKKGVGNATWNTAGERCRNVPFVKGKMESR